MNRRNLLTELFSVFLILLLLLSCRAKRNQFPALTAEAPAETFSAPSIAVLANLPDSLQPKITSLDTAPKPDVVAVPERAGAIRTVSTMRGVQTVTLMPPVRTQLPILKDPNGEIINDSTGNPFLMGYGGRSQFTYFSTDDGLVMDGIRTICMDHQGNLWFGTTGGLSRYDGRSFVTFTTAQGLSLDLILSLLEDRKGRLWIGTQGGGLSCYDGRSFVNYTTADGLGGNKVKCIAEDKDGYLWFGSTGGGLCRMNPSASLKPGEKRFVNFTTADGLSGNTIRCITEDSKGNLWIGTNGGGISKYDGKSFVTLSTKQGLANDFVHSICEDRKGYLWFGTEGSGVCRYDPSASIERAFRTYSMVDGLAGNTVSCITEDRNGNLWFGTLGGGASIYDGKSFVSFSPAQGLSSKNVADIKEDRNGNLWFATNGGGLSRYDGKSFVTYSTQLGLADNLIYSIEEDKNRNLWFGTFGGGASCFDGKSFTNYSMPQGMPGRNVLAIVCDRKGDIWLGTQLGGLSRFDGKSFTNFSTNQGLASNSIYGMCEDNSGNIWIGTFGGGLSRYDGKSFLTISKKQGLVSNDIRYVTADRNGVVWIGCDSGGLTRFDGKTLTVFSKAQGLVDRRVDCITEDLAGNIWAGTDEGLFVTSRKQLLELEAQLQEGRYNGAQHTPSKPYFKVFRKKDGLPDDAIVQILQLPDGRLAVGTNRGIVTFKASDDLSALKNLEIFNSSTGWPVKDVNTGNHCLFRDSRGIIWASTGNIKYALLRIDLSSLPRDTSTRLQPVIQRVRINGESISWNSLQYAHHSDSTLLHAIRCEEVTKFGHLLTELQRDSMVDRFGKIQFDSIAPYYPIPQNLVLPYKNNHVTFDFNAVETGRPSLVRFRYMLENYDKDWSPVLSEHRATFGNIREGKYAFKLMAQGPNGLWSKPLTYSFRVLPPWYRTWWSILMYILSLVGVMLLFSRWRQRRLKMEKQTLVRKVEERTALIAKQKKQLEKEKLRSDELLLNILPEEVAEELKASGSAKAKHFDPVTVLFSDFVGFTKASERMNAQDLIDELHACFQAFDAITSKYNIEKIKTIGDAYLAVCGLPVSDPDHALNVVRAATEMIAFISDRRKVHGENSFQIRIGVHSGSVVAGIVGIRKFAYDIWGDTVNTAARMEQNSEPGKINISQSTFELVNDQYECFYRGEIAAKNKGSLKMYFVGDKKE